MRPLLLAAAGFAMGLALTLDTGTVDACVCAGFWEFSYLRLEEFSPGLAARQSLDTDRPDEVGSITCCDAYDQREHYTLEYRHLRLDMVVR
jgi:hypothetical protein